MLSSFCHFGRHPSHTWELLRKNTASRYFHVIFKISFSLWKRNLKRKLLLGFTSHLPAQKKDLELCPPIPTGPSQAFPCVCYSQILPQPSISLESVFGTHSCLLNSLDYLFYLCWNSSTWKGVRDDLSLLVNTSLFAFGIWRQQNKTKHILTECLLSNYCWCCHLHTAFLPASEISSRERQRKGVSHFNSFQTRKRF